MHFLLRPFSIKLRHYKEMSSLKIFLSPKHPLLLRSENSSRLSSPDARLFYVLMSAGGLICEICMLGNRQTFQKMKNEESWTFSRQTEISSIWMWPLTLLKAGKYTRSWNKKSAIVPRSVEPAHVARCTSAIGRVEGSKTQGRCPSFRERSPSRDPTLEIPSAGFTGEESLFKLVCFKNDTFSPIELRKKTFRN